MMVRKTTEISKKLLKTPKIEEQPKAIAKTVEELAEDTFEYATKQKERLASEIEGVQFTFRKVQYAPEDVEKMKNMTLDEKVEYTRQLNREGKFTYVDEAKS